MPKMMDLQKFAPANSHREATDIRTREDHNNITLINMGAWGLGHEGGGLGHGA